MSSEQFEHIQRIRNKFFRASEIEIVKDSLNNAIQHLADELYKGDAHFIFELVQNAEDNAYEEPLPYLSFQLTRSDPTNSERSDGALIIENNEIGFKSDNVDAICQVGKTTKIKAQGYIGEKGIGFKSVFRITDNPYIFSSGYHFCLPKRDEETGFGYIVPRWIDTPPRGLDLSVTRIVLPLTKPDFGYKEIEKMLQDIEPETILFLSKLQEIRIKTDTGIDFTILKDDERLPEVAINVFDDKFENYKSDDFLVCTKTFDKPADIYHEKRDGIESRDVAIAFPLGKRSTATGKIFAYLPVRSDTGLPFIVNADFILLSSREDIQEVAWNRWLMECVADVVAAELLPLLKEHERLKIDFLEAFASSLNDLSTDKKNLFYPIFSKMCETFQVKDLFPTNEDEVYVSAQRGALVGSAGLIDLLDPDQLSLLFQTSWTMDWIAVYINERRTPNLWQFLRNEFNVVEVDSDVFAGKLSQSFLAKQPDNWFIKFYKFLSIGGGRPPLSLWKPPEGLLRTKPILRLQDNSLVSPDDSNVYLSMDMGSTISSQFIKEEITQDKDARRFLKDLGIQEWDIIEEVLQQVLPKYQNDPAGCSNSQYARDISKIRSAYATDSEMKKRQLRGRLMATPFIFAKCLLTKGTLYLSPDHLSFGTDGLWTRLSGRYSRVSVQEEVDEFLRTLGIPEWNIVKEVIDTVLPKYRDNSVVISDSEYQDDLVKIEQAFNTDSQQRQTHLQNELYATPFIRVESLHQKETVYLRPDQIYFGTDRLWGDFSGNYFPVSVHEESREFLRRLDVSEWDITEEVIRTILPKYSKNSPIVPIDEHQGDFAKIKLAFWVDSKEKQERFRNKLSGLQFILVERLESDSPIYRRPDQVYFLTDELRMYFDGDDSGKFISSKYDESVTGLFKALGVADSVRVERRNKNQRGHVVISNFSNYRQRGLDGFDPDIQVDGLKHAINNLIPEKSVFIWNKIAVPNSDCIQGVVERTQTQTYDDATPNSQISSQFGEFLINTPWIPDSDGNIHKPCELTLDDLPESFVRDMWLANQLGMKKDEIAELADKTGIPVDAIEQLRENPDRWKEFLAWEAAQAAREKEKLDASYPYRRDVNFGVELQGGQNSTRRKPINFGSDSNAGSTQLDLPDVGSRTTDKAYNRPESAQHNSPAFPVKSIANPERWKIKFDEGLRNLSRKEYEQRMRSVRVTTATLYTRTWLKINYTNDDEQMICQICQLEMPFKKRDGEYYFEAVEALTNDHFTTEHEAQFLALCPECAARYKEFVKQDEGAMMNMVQQLMSSDSFIVSLKLGELDTNLRFVERHWFAIKEILKKFGGGSL